MRPPSPPSAPAAYDLDMTRLEDEQLVVIVQVGGFRPARDELICRCLAPARQSVRHYACRTGLQEADCQDAQQDAVLWILEAIRRYRTDEAVKPGGCRFRSFLHRVLTSRLTDFFRHVRLWNPFPLGEGGLACLRHDRPGDARAPALDVPGPNPSTSVEECEELARLHQELGRLGEADRCLWETLAAGTPLRQAAASLGISYEAAKRWQRKLLARLKSSLTR